MYVCFLIEVESTDDVVLVTSGQQSNSATHVYTFIFTFFSLIVSRRIRSTPPGALRRPLWCIHPTSAKPDLSLYPSPNPNPLESRKSLLYVRKSASVS